MFHVYIRCTAFQKNTYRARGKRGPSEGQVRVFSDDRIFERKFLLASTESTGLLVRGIVLLNRSILTERTGPLD